jgi:hypothetical protein
MIAQNLQDRAPTRVGQSLQHRIHTCQRTPYVT